MTTPANPSHHAALEVMVAPDVGGINAGLPIINTVPSDHATSKSWTACIGLIVYFTFQQVRISIAHDLSPRTGLGCHLIVELLPGPGPNPILHVQLRRLVTSDSLARLFPKSYLV